MTHFVSVSGATELRKFPEEKTPHDLRTQRRGGAQSTCVVQDGCQDLKSSKDFTGLDIPFIDDDDDDDV